MDRDKHKHRVAYKACLCLPPAVKIPPCLWWIVAWAERQVIHLPCKSNHQLELVGRRRRSLEACPRPARPRLATTQRQNKQIHRKGSQARPSHRYRWFGFPEAAEALRIRPGRTAAPRRGSPGRSTRIYPSPLVHGRAGQAADVATQGRDVGPAGSMMGSGVGGGAEPGDGMGLDCVYPCEFGKGGAGTPSTDPPRLRPPTLRTCDHLIGRQRIYMAAPARASVVL